VVFGLLANEGERVILTCPSCGSQNRFPASRVGQQGKCGSCKSAIAPKLPYSVSSAAEFDEIVSQSPLPVLVDFWAPWCGPCKVVGPELEKLAHQRTGSLLVAKLNTDDIPQVASRFGIQGIPAFILFKGGREVGRASGAMPAAQIEVAVGLR
jgi:thioredoxin 2